VTKVLSLRVQDDLAEWADEYAEKRGVTRQALLEEGLRSFKADCEGGVPEIRAQAREQASLSRAVLGVGDCPKNRMGHVFASHSVDPRRSCVHCKRPGRDGVDQSGGFFHEATAARAELFSGLRAPKSSHGKLPAAR
jgi:predicted transcriptional regulator